MNMNKKTTNTYIDLVRPGDTVFHDNYERTVCKKDTKYDGFNGTSLFGDNYCLGTLPVIKIIFWAEIQRRKNNEHTM